MQNRIINGAVVGSFRTALEQVQVHFRGARGQITSIWLPRATTGEHIYQQLHTISPGILLATLHSRVIRLSGETVWLEEDDLITECFRELGGVQRCPATDIRFEDRSTLAEPGHSPKASTPVDRLLSHASTLDHKTT